MKARFKDVPVEALSHPIDDPAKAWEMLRGTDIEIGGAIDLENITNPPCDGPFFERLPVPCSCGGCHAVCVHIIELDESQLDAEVEVIYREMPVGVA